MNAARVLVLALVTAGCPPAQHAEERAETSAAPTSSAPVDVASAAPSASAPALSADPAAAVPLEVQTHTLDAKVKSIVPIGQKAGNVYVVDADPRFVIELELMGVAPAMADDPPGTGLSAGKTVAFAVHSPAKVMKSDADMVGKRLHFSVTRTRTKNGVEIGKLAVE